MLFSQKKKQNKSLILIKLAPLLQYKIVFTHPSTMNKMWHEINF